MSDKQNVLDQNTLDQDEKLIQNALGGVMTPQFDILKGIEEKMKPKKSIKKGLAVAFAATLALGTTAFAAQQMGAFDRLRGIVGYQHANTLTPLEIVAQQDDMLYDGIRVELVAINMSDRIGGGLDVYFTLEDTRGNRLDGDFSVDTAITPVEHGRGTYAGTQIVNRDGNGVVTMRTSRHLPIPAEGMELTFFLNEITFEVQEEQFVPMPIKLADFLVEADRMIYQEAEPNPWGTSLQFGNITDVSDFVTLNEKYTNRIINEGVPVLALGNLNHPLAPHFNFADARAQISSVGLVDGNLHVQIAHPTRRSLEEAGWEGFSHVSLFRGTAEELSHLRNARQAQIDAGYQPWEIDSQELWERTQNADVNIAFYSDGLGNAFKLNTWGVDENQHTYYRHDPRAYTGFRVDEHIFRLDLNNIDDYILIARTFSYQTLPVGWNVTFHAEPPAIQMADGAMAMEEAALLGIQYIYDVFGENVDDMYLVMQYMDCWLVEGRGIWMGSAALGADAPASQNVVMLSPGDSWQWGVAPFFFKIDAATGERLEIAYHPVDAPASFVAHDTQPLWESPQGQAILAMSNEELAEFVGLTQEQLDTYKKEVAEIAQAHFNNSTLQSVRLGRIISTPSGYEELQGINVLVDTDENGDITATRIGLVFTATDHTGRTVTINLDEFHKGYRSIRIWQCIT
ncbi:MAG: hypothetical protein FWE21_00985 [Defluviitaleaceae bacterium]|nr:hypothetical protein [Defluviitaleaceae bacterium]